jgi:hypothetical protein
MHGVSDLFEATPAAVAHDSPDLGWRTSQQGAPWGESSFALFHQIIIRFDRSLHRGNPKCRVG